MINERIFGSPISGQVRKKLEDRQRVAGEVAFGESIEAVYPDKMEKIKLIYHQEHHLLECGRVLN